jgi:stage V sporulation protein AC
MKAILVNDDKSLKWDDVTDPILGNEDRLMCPKLTQAEGWILGVGAKMFTIAGPVIVYGTVASVVHGLIYWITTLF